MRNTQNGPGNIYKNFFFTKKKQLQGWNYSELYEFVEPGAFLQNPPESYARAWNAASAETF